MKTWFLVASLGISYSIPFTTPTIFLGLTARAVSLMTVIATSSAVSAGGAGRNTINLRLGMVLEVASTAGGLIAGITVERLSKGSLSLIFAVVTALIAILMVTRLEKRNVLAADAETGLLGGRFYEAESGREVAYRVRRLPVAMFASLVAGAVSGTLGIGGGILKVPVLNGWCGVPLRAAAATSALMIGVTATGGAIIYYGHGDLRPLLAAPAVLGVQAGSWVGTHVTQQASVKWLKLLMSALLFVVAVLMFVRSMQ